MVNTHRGRQSKGIRINTLSLGLPLCVVAFQVDSVDEVGAQDGNEGV